MRRKKPVRWVARVGAVMGAALVVAACGGTSSSPTPASSASTGGNGAATKSALTVAMVTAFTGSNAYFGVADQTACSVASKVVNSGGGVLGHDLTCKLVDDKDDPADAVPAVNQLLATTNNLGLVAGIVDETSAVMPILSAAKVPAFSLIGDPRYDHTTYPYFFRLISSDALGGTALGYYVATHGFTHAAAVFTSDSGAQTSAGPAVAAYKKAGGTLVANLTLQPGSTDYRTEAAALVKAHPDAILTEMDSATAVTFLQEVAQLNSGTVPPLIGTEKLTRGNFLQTLAKSVGSAPVASFRTIVQAPLSPDAGFQQFYSTILSFGSKIQNPSQYKSDYYTQSLYDAIILSSLAMLKAHSTTPSAWVPMITSLTNGTAGAVTVSTFGAGKVALAAGKQIRYVGAIGPITLDQYHNTKTPFAIEKISPTTYKPAIVGEISAAALASAG